MAAVVAAAPVAAGVGLADPAGRQVGAATTAAPTAAATAAVSSLEWSSTTTSSSPGRSCAASGPRRWGSAAASSRAGTMTAIGWAVGVAGGGSGRVDHSSSQPNVHPTAYSAHATPPIVAPARSARRVAIARSVDVERWPNAPAARSRNAPPADVTEVAPGVLRCQLPIDMPGLGHVNCYVLEDERGVALVDPGLPGKATFPELTARLASAGIPLARVHTVVVTHSHPDHFGGAGGCATRPAPTSSPTGASA